MGAGWYPGRCKDCAQTAAEGGARCEACRLAHNAREAARRDDRKARGRCAVCGERAATVAGEPLTTCPTHRAYYAERARQ